MSVVRDRPDSSEVPRTLAEPAPRTLGRVDQLGLWGNLGVSLLGFTGAVAVLQPGGHGGPRLPLAAALLATLVGTVLGSCAVAATAALGARTGAPTMVLLRGLFGARASAVPTVLNIVQMVGWGTFEIVTIATALGQVVGGVPQAVWVVGCGALTTALAVRPLGSVRLLRRYVSVAVLLALGYLAVRLAGQPDPYGGPVSWSGFPVAVDTTLAVAVSWVPMAADYARHSRGTRAAALGAFAGYGAMQVACYAVGLLAVVAAGGGSVFGVFLAVPLGAAAFLVVTVRELDQSFADVYSTTVSTQNLRPQWDRRVVSVVVGLLTTALALLVDVYDYASFLSLIGSVFVPLSGVLVADWLCRGSAGWDLGPDAPTRWSMLLPWAAGFVVYQLVNPGQVGDWASMWHAVARTVGFTPQPWMSASLLSFLVAAAIAVPLSSTGSRRRRRGCRPGR
jgi:putative hydroxymethylpyrimidine transporter CytX